MKTEWDYTGLANAYLKRPEYAPNALKEIFTIAGLKADDRVCDIGAGVARLTLSLAAYGCKVDAIEPNEAMRAKGMKRTQNYKDVHWYEGTGEDTGRESGVYDFVIFGSSFNVCDRLKALKETYRLLKSKKYFACLWNNPDKSFPIEKHIEEIIQKYVPDYGYGKRREDPSGIIAESGLFDPAQKVEGRVVWPRNINDIIDAWRSHISVQRQTGDNFPKVIRDICDYLYSQKTQTFDIPYITQAWIARRKD